MPPQTFDPCRRSAAAAAAMFWSTRTRRRLDWDGRWRKASEAAPPERPPPKPSPKRARLTLPDLPRDVWGVITAARPRDRAASSPTAAIMRAYQQSPCWPILRNFEFDIGYLVEYQDGRNVYCKPRSASVPEVLTGALTYRGIPEREAVHEAFRLTGPRRRESSLWTRCDLDCRFHPRPTRVHSLSAVGCIRLTGRW